MGKVATFVEQSSGKLAKKFINIKTNTKLGPKEQDVNFFRHCITEET
jgi:hypothetical protein